MGRKILFITTDQQRYDTLGCNGGTIARTPVIDGAGRAQGVRYERAHPQSVVCMPSRSHHDHRPAREHARRVDERRAAARGRPVGGRGAARRRLPHRAHRQAALRAVPRPVRPLRREPASPATARFGPHRGFEHFESATHGAAGPAALRPLAGVQPPRGRRHVLPGARRLAGGQRAGWRRHRRTAGVGEQRSPRSGTTPTGWPTARSPGSTRSAPTTTGSAG